MTNKRFKAGSLSAVLVVCLLLSLVCGCGKDNEAEGDEYYTADEEYLEEGDYYTLNDGFIDYLIAKSPDVYIKEGFTQKDANLLAYRDELKKTYVDAKYFIIDFKDDASVLSKDVDGNEVRGFSVAGPNGNELRFEAKNVMLSDKNELVFNYGSELTLLTAVDGLLYVAPNVSYANDNGDMLDSILFKGAANPANTDEVSSSDDLLYMDGTYAGMRTGYMMMENYAGFGYFQICVDIENSDEIRMSEILIRYNGVRHDITSITLDTDFYGYLAEGDLYDSSKEIFSLEEGVFEFYLLFKSDVEMAKRYPDITTIFGTEDFEVKDLCDKSGNMKSKDEPLSVGDYLMVDVKGAPCKVELPVYGLYYPKNLYDSMPASNVPDMEDVNVLVVPYCFADQEFTRQDDINNLCSVLGKISDFEGNVTDYPATGDYFTFSDYYEKASYGKLNLTSYVTDCYKIEDKTFADYRDIPLEEMNVNHIQAWINEKYAGYIDKFDQNKDGILDAVILVCQSGEEQDYYFPISNGGAASTVNDYNFDNALKDGKAALSHYIVINADKFVVDGEKTANVLIHEFGHQIGLIDYYDVTYSGQNAVGGYDMQSDNYGDWNPFSKFAAGWTEPTVLDEAAIGDEITVTIKAFSESGDTIIVPTQTAVYNADGTLNPFNEYIMIDLFSPSGVNTYDAKKYNLNQTGVRIYHVDSRLIGIPIDTADGNGMTVGDYVHNNSYSEIGMFCIETIQKSGINTFTDFVYESTAFCNNDLFYAGDKFSMRTHSSFFYNGLMDDNAEFPYEITVVSIDGDEATIKISK